MKIFFRYKSIIAQLIIIAFLPTIITVSAFGENSAQSKIIKSFISEDASFNVLAMSFTDIVSVKKKKDVFLLDDKKITWSACIRGGLMTNNSYDYAVMWYAPDGMLFEKQEPKQLFSDCSGLKSSLLIDKEKLSARTGLWKVEVSYKNDLIDNRYFYLLEKDTKEIVQTDIDSLEALILKNKPQVKVAEVVEPPKPPEELIPQPVAPEAPKDIPDSYEVVAPEKKSPETMSETATKSVEPSKLSENLSKLEMELIDETKKAEDLFYKTGALYDDAAVLDYINKMAARLTSNKTFDKNTQLKIRIIREPTVNAFAMATGSIYIHTGALAKLENEDQLAHLIGHEISHVANKDMVYFVNSYHKKTIVYKIFDIILAPTSVFFGVLGSLTQTAFLLFHVATVTGYGRIIEARSDKEGMLWATESSYNPSAGPGLMQVFLSEADKYQTGPEIFFLMTHPTTKWRLTELNKIIAEKGAAQRDVKIADDFLRNMAKIKLYNATLNIKWDRLEHAKDNIQWVLEKDPNNPEAHYLAGEIYRLEAEDKKKVKDELNYKKWSELNKPYKKTELEDMWYKKSIEEYNKAIACDPKYANSYKGLALAYKYKDDKENALANLRKYLEVNPAALDKRYVNSLIERLSKPDEKK